MEPKKQYWQPPPEKPAPEPLTIDQQRERIVKNWAQTASAIIVGLGCLIVIALLCKLLIHIILV